MEMGFQRQAPTALPPGKTRYPLYSRLGGPQSRFGRVREISPPTGIRSPDGPACSESLYRLSYPGPLRPCGMYVNHWTVKGQCFKWMNGLAARCSKIPVKSLRTERPTVGFVRLDFLAAGVTICFTFEQTASERRERKRFSTHLTVILRVWY
jgi:hypothetical protein